jgi:hypothetical protein
MMRIKLVCVENTDVIKQSILRASGLKGYSSQLSEVLRTIDACHHILIVHQLRAGG